MVEKDNCFHFFNDTFVLSDKDVDSSLIENILDILDHMLETPCDKLLDIGRKGNGYAEHCHNNGYPTFHVV